MLCSSTTVIARSLHRKMCSFQTFPTEGFPSYPIEISPCLPMFPRPTAPGVLSVRPVSSFRSHRARLGRYSSHSDLSSFQSVGRTAYPLSHCALRSAQPYYLSMLPMFVYPDTPDDHSHLSRESRCEH